MAPPKSNEKKIRQLCEMGCSRAAAKSALRASKWDFEEVRSDRKPYCMLSRPVEGELLQH